RDTESRLIGLLSRLKPRPTNISKKVASGKLDIADFDRCVILAMATQDLILPRLFEFHNLELWSADVRDNLSGYFGLSDSRARNNLLFVGADRENLVKSDVAADLSIQALDADCLARHGAILLPPTTNYGVHAASQQSCETSIVA